MHNIAGFRLIGSCLSIRIADSSIFFRGLFATLNFAILQLTIQVWCSLLERFQAHKMAGGAPPKGLSSKLEKKRKRQADESTKQDKPDTTSAAPAAASEPNKKKRKKAKKSKKQPEEDGKTQDRKDGIDESIGKMDGRLLADYFAQRAKKLDKELSAVELSDLSVPGMYQL